MRRHSPPIRCGGNTQAVVAATPKGGGMSDAVQEIMEAMVPELEDLARKQIFNQVEIKEIVRRRRDFEYKLKRRDSQKSEYLRYIAYESALDKLRARRKKRLGFGKKSKTSASDFSMQKRLHFIFDRMLRKWKGDVDLWGQYIDFCLAQGATKILSTVFARALQLHPRNTNLWKRASTWHFDDAGDIRAARVMCQRGLRMLPSSTVLWAHYLRLELCYIDKLRQRQKLLGIEKPSADDDSPTSLAVATERIASAVLSNAKKAIPANSELLLELAAVCSEFPDTDALQHDLLRSVTRDTPNIVAGWLALAQHKLQRMHRSRSPVAKEAIMAAQQAAITTLEECVEANESEPAFWEAYRQLARGQAAQKYDIPDATLRQKSVSVLLSVYRRATQALGGTCGEDMVIAYCTDLSLLGCVEEAITVGERGCEQLVEAGTHVGQLAHLVLCLVVKLCSTSHEETDTQVSVETMFQRCLGWASAIPPPESEDVDVPAAAQVDSSIVSVWQTLLDYMVTNGASSADVSSRYEAAVASCRPGGTLVEFRIRQLHWHCRSHGISSARALYTNMLQTGQMVGSNVTIMVDACINLELSQPAADMDQAAIRHLFEQATSHEAVCTRPSVWLQWIALEQGWGEFDRASTLYFRAMHLISDPDQFVTMHSLQQMR